MAIELSRSASSHHQSALAEINMIPMIDILLVLLVIVLVTAPLVSQSVDVRLPATSTMPQQAAATKPLVLSMRADGALFWDQHADPLPKEQWAQRLQTWFSEHPQTQVQLRADARTPYEPIAQLMAMASGIGIKQLALMTQPSNHSPNTTHD